VTVDVIPACRLGQTTFLGPLDAAVITHLKNPPWVVGE
jgi:hypothetical protein